MEVNPLFLLPQNKRNKTKHQNIITIPHHTATANTSPLHNLTHIITSHILTNLWISPYTAFPLQVHNATGVFIINLTLSDLMFCVFNLPLAASLFGQCSWVHTGFVCLLFPILRYGLVAVSVFTVLAITINRYVMIAHPQLYSKWVMVFGLYF